LSFCISVFQKVDRLRLLKLVTFWILVFEFWK